jgi:hypothetical protein
MRKRVLIRATLWISIAALIYSFGCILSPEEESAPPIEDPIKFEDLTEKEHVIINLVNSYRALKDQEYLRVLLKAEDEKPAEYGGGTYGSMYYWFNQVEDDDLELNIDLEEDHKRTMNMFFAANGMPQDPEKHPVLDKLTLEITAGTWQEVDSLFGGECQDCWKTLREYDIWLYLLGDDDDRIHGYDNVEFYIVPVQDGDKKTYRIAIANDMLAN